MKFLGPHQVESQTWVPETRLLRAVCEYERMAGVKLLAGRNTMPAKPHERALWSCASGRKRST